MMKSKMASQQVKKIQTAFVSLKTLEVKISLLMKSEELGVSQKNEVATQAIRRHVTLALTVIKLRKLYKKRKVFTVQSGTFKLCCKERALRFRIPIDMKVRWNSRLEMIEFTKT